MKHGKGESSLLYNLLDSLKLSTNITPENIRYIVENISNKEKCDDLRKTCLPHNYIKRIKHFEQIVARDLLKYHHLNNKSSGLKAGYVYLISNPAWNDFKVGSTTDVNDRLRSYQTYSPLRDYILEFYFFSFNRLEDETKVLEAFNSKNEWLQAPKDDIIRFMKSLAKYR